MLRSADDTRWDQQVGRARAALVDVSDGENEALIGRCISTLSAERYNRRMFALILEEQEALRGATSKAKIEGTSARLEKTTRDGLRTAGEAGECVARVTALAP